MSALSAYENINLRNLNLRKYAVDTPAADWVASNEIYLSEFLERQMATLLRYLTMWKYGGTYMDMDLILQMNLYDLPPNCAAAQSRGLVDDAFLHFETSFMGRNVSEECLK